MSVKTYEVTKWDIYSVAKLISILFLVFGIILGVLYAVIFSITNGPLVGITALVIIAVVYPIDGFILYLLIGALYNWLAKKIGGMKFELKEVK